MDNRQQLEMKTGPFLADVRCGRDRDLWSITLLPDEGWVGGQGSFQFGGGVSCKIRVVVGKGVKRAVLLLFRRVGVRSSCAMCKVRASHEQSCVCVVSLWLFYEELVSLAVCDTTHTMPRLLRVVVCSPRFTKTKMRTLRVQVC